MSPKTNDGANKMEEKMKKSLVDHTYRDYSQVEISELVENFKRVNEELFPAKLHRILSTPEYAHIIAWKQHGRAWAVLKKSLFINVVLPTYFNHNNFESFNRSVNGWGFKRLVREGPDQKSYYHELFLSGRPELTSAMSRLISPGRRLPNKVDEPDFYDISKNYPLRDPPTTVQPLEDDQADISNKQGPRPPLFFDPRPVTKRFKSSHSHPSYASPYSQPHQYPPPYSQTQPTGWPYPAPNPPQLMRYQHQQYPSQPSPSYKYPTPHETLHYSSHYPSPGLGHDYRHYSAPALGTGPSPSHSIDQTHQFAATHQCQPWGPPPNAPFQHSSTPRKTTNVVLPYQCHASPSHCYQQNGPPQIYDAAARDNGDNNPVKMVPILYSDRDDPTAHPEYNYTNNIAISVVNEADESKPLAVQESVNPDYRRPRRQVSHSSVTGINHPTPYDGSQCSQPLVLKSLDPPPSTMKTWKYNAKEVDSFHETFNKDVVFNPAKKTPNILQHDSMHYTAGATNDIERTMGHDCIAHGVSHGATNDADITQEHHNPLDIDNFPIEEEECKKKYNSTVHP